MKKTIWNVKCNYYSGEIYSVEILKIPKNVSIGTVDLGKEGCFIRLRPMEEHVEIGNPDRAFDTIMKNSVYRNNIINCLYANSVSDARNKEE